MPISKIDDRSAAKSFTTPISSRKKYQKLSLKKHPTSSCTRLGVEEVTISAEQSEKNRNYQQEADKSSLFFFDDENFNTPPFVTKLRPKYENNCSTPRLSSDFIGNTPEVEAVDSQLSLKYDDGLVESTPVDCRNIEEYKIFDSVYQNDIICSPKQEQLNTSNINNDSHLLDILDSNQLRNSLDFRLDKSNVSHIDQHYFVNKVNEENNTPDNRLIRLSPKSANIMTSIYGDVWKKTPGLFKKTQPRFGSQLVNKEHNPLAEKLDSLKMYLETLSNNKNKESSDLITNMEDINECFHLKPKMLSFDIDNDNCCSQNKQPIETNMKSDNSKALPLITANLDALDDSLFSFKRVRKKQVFSSTSSSDLDDEISKIKDCKFLSDYEKEQNQSGNERINREILKSNRKSFFRIENDLECSVILIESDMEPNEGAVSKGKGTERKNRKLFSKHNNIFDDVKFVAEIHPDEKIKHNRVYEVIDDNIEGIFVMKQKDKENFDVLSDNIQKISLKEVEVKPKKDIKKVNRKPREKINNKKNGPELKACDVNVDDIKVYSFMASLSDTVPSWRCDKEAKYYKDKFKSKKVELTHKLFAMYNEKVYSGQLDADLPITWSSSLQTTAGRAYNKIKKSKNSASNLKTSSVELSLKVLDSAQRLRDTLAHELCHVAAWMIDGQLRDGHGPYWKKWVSRTLEVFPELGSIPICHSLSIHYKYTFKCTRCGYGVNRQSKSIDVTRKACGYCGGRFECILNKKNKDGLVVSTPVKRASRELKGFALYVKENYGNVRGSNTPHKQAMQYLGKQYAKTKAAQSSDDDGGKGH